MTQQIKKRKILLLSDHPLSSSGVGTQARYLIKGLIDTGKYSFICFGGAVKHEDYRQVNISPDLVIKPTDGFGNRDLLRLTLAQEKPDVMMLFTDPRFFVWCWEMSEEIHQICPIAYNHLWDNFPAPEFNKVLYESTDLVNCINWPTYTFCKEWFPEKTNFIPHAVPREIFYPMKDEDITKNKKLILKGRREDTFIGFWVSRNARRKVPGDVLDSWKLFLDKLEAKHGHRNAVLVMHTDPLDQEGPNLHHVVNMLKLQDHVIFSTDRLDFDKMNVLYNVADFTTLISLNEGFGLSLLESMMTATPVIALKTGGMTRQVVDHRDGTENGIALEPEVKSLVGSQLVPYIYEDLISNDSVAESFLQMYEYGPQKRRELGMKALQYASSEFSIENLIQKWDESLTKLIDGWNDNKSSTKQWACIEL